MHVCLPDKLGHASQKLVDREEIFLFYLSSMLSLKNLHINGYSFCLVDCGCMQE